MRRPGAITAAIVLGACAVSCGAGKSTDRPDDAAVPDRDAALDAGADRDASEAPDASPDAGEPDSGVPTACQGILPTPGVEITAVLVTGGLFSPIFVTAPAGDPRLFVVNQGGQIQLVVGGVVREALFADLTDVVNAGGAERGLLGMAFHPGYADNGAFYVYFSTRDGTSVIAELHVSADPDLADRASLVPLVTMPDVNFVHNAGMLAFGPIDGHLYASTGDDADPSNAPDETSLLGKILRVAVDGAGGYAVPADNPLPVHAYDHGVGTTVIGGYVYRGRALPDVDGTYFFADAYTQMFWGFDAGTAAENLREWEIELGAFLSSFGEDGCGELYLVDYYGASLYRIEAESL